mmetsp:Transcript_79006/g.144034  ORF Transcript_79006/g.144034 Transcript_79006/m.144034 type:complete len:947 (-) Transcript_79006:66-2906(-)
MAWCCYELASKQGYFAFIALTFVVDLLVCLCAFFLDKSSKQEQQDPDVYASSASDTVLCCVLRMISFPLLARIAYGTYNRTVAASPIMRLKEEEARQQNSEVNSPQLNNGANGTELKAPLVNDESASTKASDQADSASTASVCSTSTNGMSAFEMKQEHTLTMKKAEKRKNVVLSILFVVCIVLSMYNGLKCVNFHYDDRIIVVQALLLATVIFLINAEFFLVKDFLSKLTEEEGELIASMHMHPLFFETGLKCHICDVCHESMKGPNYVAYRCRTCDFDLCPRCYKQKDKANGKGFGARAIRRDGEQLTTWTFFLRIIKLALDFRCTLFACLTCLLLNQSLIIAAPHIQGNIFDGVYSYLSDPEGNGKDEFTRAMTGYLTICILQGCFGGLKSLFQELVMRQLACSVRTKLFTSVIRLDIAFFDSMHTGQLTSRLTNDASQMVQPLSTLMNDLLANVMNLVGGMFMAFFTSWKLSLLALTIVPPITYSYRLYAKWGRSLNRSIYCAYGEANSTATEAIHNIRTVRGFSTETHETDKYNDSINTAMAHGVKNAYVGGSVNAFTTYLNMGTGLLIMWYGGELVCDSRGKYMSIGMLVTFQLYWSMMNNAFIALGNVFNDLIRSSSAAERVCSLIDAKPEVDPDAGREVTREACKGHLELRGVQFRYQMRPDNLVLKGVDMEMHPCTTTALVGKSGGGKSTLVHLLMRFYEPTDGMILLDGQDTRSLSSRSVRKFCGFVAQDTQLFATSIEDNLAYGLGRPHTKEEVIEACRAANAHEFIMETEDQYETRVGEKGVLLSGGQRQRLAIARCFLRKPRLLFLDEATSALDAENEAIVQQSLDMLIEQLQCTVVLIAHRLSTVINANQIAVVHKGSIIERGTHEELLTLGGVYAQLVKRQMARDASSVMDEKDKKEAKPSKGGGKGSSMQTEIDELIEEMEKTGGLNLEK